MHEEHPDPSVYVSLARETGADRVAHGTPQRTRDYFYFSLGFGQTATCTIGDMGKL